MAYSTFNKCRGLEASVVLDARSPINVGSLSIKRQGFQVRILINARGV